MRTTATQLSEEIKGLGLERFVLELESDGLTIVPPEVTGVTPELLDRCTEVLCKRFEEMTGCAITVEDGPLGELEWSSEQAGRTTLEDNEKAPPATQMIIQQILQLDRCFRDLTVNPVADALIDHLVGPSDFLHAAAGGRARRLSSSNSFVKWQGDFGYGPSLALHCDQGLNPLPWGRTALTANATWCLTDYTLEGGALAYVPGSHRSNGHPVQPRAAEKAVPAVAPRGSVIVFPGTTWHGAFPKKTPGLRLCAVPYYRHVAVLPQENTRITLRDTPWEDCADPDRMRELIGFDDTFPYLEQNQEVPRLAARPGRRVRSSAGAELPAG